MLKIKLTLALILGAILMLVALQNMAPVELTVLLWTFETRRIVLIAFCVIVGFVIGRTSGALHRLMNNKEEPKE